ncbi:uncharacterized protein LOC135825236 isoform X1 [Sycon ciliatum]|uniref:uncharacterized protein LOC135825236 isoform X1 n=2 Tax=Sycon ciliatum TaxID=27933 RepID=UPI0031F64537
MANNMGRQCSLLLMLCCCGIANVTQLVSSSVVKSNGPHTAAVATRSNATSQTDDDSLFQPMQQQVLAMAPLQGDSYLVDCLGKLKTQQSTFMTYFLNNTGSDNPVSKVELLAGTDQQSVSNEMATPRSTILQLSITPRQRSSNGTGQFSYNYRCGVRHSLASTVVWSDESFEWNSYSNPTPAQRLADQKAVEFLTDTSSTDVSQDSQTTVEMQIDSRKQSAVLLPLQEPIIKVIMENETDAVRMICSALLTAGSILSKPLISWGRSKRGSTVTSQLVASKKINISVDTSSDNASPNSKYVRSVLSILPGQLETSDMTYVYRCGLFHVETNSIEWSSDAFSLRKIGTSPPLVVSTGSKISSPVEGHITDVAPQKATDLTLTNSKAAHPPVDENAKAGNSHGKRSMVGVALGVSLTVLLLLCAVIAFIYRKRLNAGRPAVKRLDKSKRYVLHRRGHVRAMSRDENSVKQYRSPSSTSTSTIQTMAPPSDTSPTSEVKAYAVSNSRVASIASVVASPPAAATAVSAADSYTNYVEKPSNSSETSDANASSGRYLSRSVSPRSLRSSEAGGSGLDRHVSTRSLPSKYTRVQRRKLMPKSESMIAKSGVDLENSVLAKVKVDQYRRAHSLQAAVPVGFKPL